MSNATDRYVAVIKDIDALNADDPRRVTDGSSMRPREVVYAERMSACLERLYPAAPEALQIAARAQHICRWQIPRDGYPAGRDGYNAWRTACREHHAKLVSGIMSRHGYAADQIAKVAKVIRKEELKRDPESQALENVAAVVFVHYELEGFIGAHPTYDDAKVAGILKKTLRKMDATGHAALVGLPLTANAQRVVALALR